MIVLAKSTVRYICVCVLGGRVGGGEPSEAEGIKCVQNKAGEHLIPENNLSNAQGFFAGKCGK